MKAKEIRKAKINTGAISTVLLVFCLLVKGTVAFAQYPSLIDTNKIWEVESYYNWDYNGQNFFPPDVTWTYQYFKGDTTINDTLYHKLMARQFFFYHEDADTTIYDRTFYPEELLAFFHDDTVHGKLGVRIPEYNLTVYNYDRNLQEGDTFRYESPYLNPGMTLRVTNVSPYFYTANESYTKVEFVGSVAPSSYYLLGHGGSNGLIEPLQHDFNTRWQNIHCVQNSKEARHFRTADPCALEHDVTHVREVGNDLLGANIFPNPFDVALFIQLNANSSTAVEVSIYDLNGTRVLQQKLPWAKTENPLDVSQLKAGVYFLVLSHSHGNSLRRKIVKTR
ncbi:MAG: T9SS type A sorting domain-containing protein [Luteibaculum sp.]